MSYFRSGKLCTAIHDRNMMDCNRPSVLNFVLLKSNLLRIDCRSRLQSLSYHSQTEVTVLSNAVLLHLANQDCQVLVSYTLHRLLALFLILSLLIFNLISWHIFPDISFLIVCNALLFYFERLRGHYYVFNTILKWRLVLTPETSWFHYEATLQLNFSTCKQNIIKFICLMHGNVINRQKVHFTF